MARTRDSMTSSGARIRTSRGEVPFELDALRGDLYRLIDAVARSGPDRRDALVEAFEQLWVVFKEASAKRP